MSVPIVSVMPAQLSWKNDWDEGVSSGGHPGDGAQHEAVNGMRGLVTGIVVYDQAMMETMIRQ